MAVARDVHACGALGHVGVRAGQCFQNGTLPVRPRLLLQLRTAVWHVAQRLVVAEHGGRRQGAEALVAGVHIAKAAGVGVLVEHVVPRWRCAGAVQQRAVEVDVGHQPRRPLQALSRCGHKIGWVWQHARGVQVDAFDHATQTVQRWQAQRCIVALPVFVAARVVQAPPAFVQQAAQRLHWAPWLVANIHLSHPLQDRPGAAPAWDNVLYQDATPGGLGYVDASHQRLDARAAGAAPTVLTYYQALGELPGARAALAQQPWTHWADAIVHALSAPHPDLRARATHIAITRHGHAMATPVPGTQQFLSQIALKSPPDKRYQLSNGERMSVLPSPTTARLAFAHADWSGYSVFEEAFTRGHHAALAHAR